MRLVLRVICLLVMSVSGVIAAVPPTMNYQSILTDAGGIPVTDGNYVVTFSIFSLLTGGAPLWSELQTVTTTDGLFNAILGSVVPIPDTAVMGTGAYLEISVMPDGPMAPRTRLTSSAFAMVSSSVLGEGPVLLEYEDVASGAQSVYSLGVKPGGSVPVGKNIRKNITVTLLSAAESAELEEIIGISDASKSAVAIPSFMKNARKVKASETAQGREILDTDSGYAHIVTFVTPNDTTEWIELINAPGGSVKSAVAIPAFMKNARKAKTSEAEASLRQILDPDSGYAETVQIRETGFASVLEKGATQTREHVLLARQVGVATSAQYPSLELQTHNTGAEADILFADSDNDTSRIEVSAKDNEQLITMSSSTAGTKWPNIVLKRGVAATEMTLSHVAAGSASVIQATVGGAAGARFGINTSAPTMAFQLVGSGCYTGTFGVCSDKRYKTNIKTLSEPLELVKRMRGVAFDWKVSDYPDRHFPVGEQVGFIAQEVEDVVPGVVQTDVEGYKSVDYARLVPILLEAVKEQQRQIDELKSAMRSMTP